MPSSNRLHDLAVRGWLIAFLLTPIPALAAPPDDPGDPATAQEDTGERQPNPAPQEGVAIEVPFAPQIIGSGSADLSDAQDGSEDAKRKEEHEKADLKAQEDMAYWARWMFFATFASVAIAATAVWLVYLTLKEAGKTTRAAVAGAKAADDTVKSMDATAERQLRAYVTIEAIQTNPANNPMAYQIVWKNTGQTPAINVVTHINWMARTDQLPGDYQYVTAGGFNDAAALGSGQGLNAWPIFISGEDVQRAIRGIHTIYVWGSVEYNDMFPNTPRRRTEFCYELVFDNSRVNARQIGMGNRIYGPHNGVDEGCLLPPEDN